MPQINLADYVPCTESEGPGRRFALWVQGCLKRCVGCCNPQMLQIALRRIVDCDEVSARILQAKSGFGVEGVTFLGGEPLLQAKGLSAVAKRCQEAGLSVVVFTGYTWQEMERLDLPGARELLLHTDILVDGPYLPDQRESVRNWVGSRNQVFHYLTARYPRGIEFDPRYVPSMELRLGKDGSLRMNGWPTLGSGG